MKSQKKEVASLFQGTRKDIKKYLSNPIVIAQGNSMGNGNRKGLEHRATAMF
jgi:hypothetical protein